MSLQQQKISWIQEFILKTIYTTIDVPEEYQKLCDQFPLLDRKKFDGRIGFMPLISDIFNYLLSSARVKNTDVDVYSIVHCLMNIISRRIGNLDMDPYQWLEGIQSKVALQWVQSQNNITETTLMRDPRFEILSNKFYQLLTSEDRIPMPHFVGGMIYNFWQDKKYIHGIWSRTTARDFETKSPHWETVLDLDKLSSEERINWVWVSQDDRTVKILYPESERCLIGISDGGTDAKVVREFDLKKKKFVEDGFNIPLCRTYNEWIDKNRIFVGTDFKDGRSSTVSGYPRQIRIWTRGTSLYNDSKLIYELQPNELSLEAKTFFRPQGNLHYLNIRLSWFERKYYLLFELEQAKDVILIKLPFPPSCTFETIFKGYLVVTLTKDWRVGNTTFINGSVLVLSLDYILSLERIVDETIAEIAGVTIYNIAISSVDDKHIHIIFRPTYISSFSSCATTRNHIYLQINENVTGQLLRVSLHSNGQWVTERIRFPNGGNGNAKIISNMYRFVSHLYVLFESYLIPKTIYRVDDGSQKPRLIKSRKPVFDATNIIEEQYWVKSKDQKVDIPYFIIHQKKMKLDGNNPTLMFGYGGFNHALTPHYLESSGILWIEKGGVFVECNIRGGGEFGPQWHKSAILENRQRSYDDFISIAEDMIRRGITSPRRLGILGASNGGLLVSAVLIQRPDLWNAVVSGLGLMDMLRYHLLLTGRNWMSEYGNPDDPKDDNITRKYLSRYSPYQNIVHVSMQRYPKTFFWASTKDDRVHPGHSRKMVARLLEMGQDVFYYEMIDGGHNAAANLKEMAKKKGLEFTYLYQQLMD